MGFSLVVESGGYSVVVLHRLVIVVHGLVTVVASLVAEPRC